jgi:hypothetical protein
MQQGGCLCGAVRYRVEGSPISSGICHCRTCRKISSAPTLPFVMFPADAIAFTKGDPIEIRSSPFVSRRFCGRCGSPLTYRSDNEPSFIDVMTCSLDNPEAFPPSFHIWIGEKLAWDSIADGLSAFKATRPTGE